MQGISTAKAMSTPPKGVNHPISSPASTPPTGHGQVDEQAEEPGHEADGGTDQDEQVVGAHRVGASAGQRPEQPGQPTRLDAGEQVHDAITARMVTRA